MDYCNGFCCCFFGGLELFGWIVRSWWAKGRRSKRSARPHEPFVHTVLTFFFGSQSTVASSLSVLFALNVCETDEWQRLRGWEHSASYEL